MSTETAATEHESGLLRGLDVTVTAAALLFWAGVLGWAHTQAISQVRFATAFVGGILTVYALNETRLAISDGDWIDGAVLIASSVALMTASAFFAINFQDVYLQRQGYALEHDMLARLVIISLMYLTWREFGNVFLGLIFAVFGYAMYGNLVPGVLGHAGMQQATLLQATVTDLYGFYGSLTQITASWIAPFLLYAGLLFAYGAFDLILRVAIVAGKYIESGIAQTAVLSSAIIGSINGSYTANAAMTGVHHPDDAGSRDERPPRGWHRSRRLDLRTGAPARDGGVRVRDGVVPRCSVPRHRRRRPRTGRDLGRVHLCRRPLPRHLRHQ